MPENTVSTLAGLFKESYGDDVVNAVPSTDRFIKDIKYANEGQREGDSFHQPVRLSRAAGWTMNGTSGGAYSLNAAEPGRSQDAIVNASSFTIRETIGYDEVARLLKTPGKAKKRAFVSATSYMIEAMQETANFVLETQILYGQKPIGITSGQATDSGTSQEFTFTQATWIPALWAGLENGFVDVYDTTEATQRNSTGTMQVTAVDFSDRQVTFTGTESEMDAIVSTDVFYLRGTKDNGMVGLEKILANTSGTIHSINSSTYSLWQGNTFSAGSGPLTMSKLLQAINLPVNKGMDGELCVYCSPKSWTDLNNDIAALRRVIERSGGGSVSIGNEDIGYYGQNGPVKIKPHIYMMPSKAIIIPPGKCKRLGASELTANLPGSNPYFFENLPEYAGYGLRMYWHQAVFVPRPAHTCYINNIVNSDDGS